MNDNKKEKTGSLIDNEFININNIIKILIRRKRYVFSIGSITFIIAIFVLAYNRIVNPVYRGSFTLLISDPMSISNKNNRMSEDIQLFEELAANTTNNDIPTLIEYLKSPLLLKSLANQYNYSYFGLAGNINIRTGGASRNFRDRADGILKVELFTKRPKRDLQLLVDLSNTYLQTSLNQRQQKLKDGLSFLDQQEPILQKKNNDLQAELVQFREKFALLEPETEGLSLKKQQEDLNQQLLNFSSERNRLLIVKEEILKDNISALGFEEQIGSNNINGLKIKDYDQSLLKQIFALENEISEKRIIFKEESKIIERLKSKLNELKPALRDSQLQAVDTALRLNNAKIKDIKSKINNLEKIFLEKPSLIKEFNSLKQNLAISQKNLIGLVSARENFQLKIAQSSVPWRILQEPFIKKQPIKPSLSRGLISAIFSSTIFGIFAALLRDKTDFVYHNINEVKEYIKQPILGSIPNIEVFKDFSSNDDTILDRFDVNKLNLSKKEKKKFLYQKFLYQESLRNFYSSIRFLSTDKKIKIISNTSSLPAEGKTLINILLAKTISELGQKVLLIDVDLRKPQIHKRLGVDNLRGLSNFLIEPNFEYKKIIQKIDENLEVITAGTVVPDPARLLSSDKMKSFLKELSQSDNYDYVLIDSPPILGLADSILNAEFIDGYILVVTIGKIVRNLPVESINRIMASNAPLLGIVTNEINRSKINQKNSKSGYGGYGYGGYGYAGYGYAGYGYGEYGETITNSYFEDELNKEESLKDREDSKNEVDFKTINNFNKSFLNIYKKLLTKLKIVLNWLDR